MIAEVIEIEEANFPRPWGAEVFAEDLKTRQATLHVLRQHRVTCFCLHQRLYDEVHILQIATHPQAQRRGHAASLLSHVIDEARRSQAQALLLEVRPSNLPAIRLYERLGFAEIGRRRHYYHDNNEDALMMERRLWES